LNKEAKSGLDMRDFAVFVSLSFPGEYAGSISIGLVSAYSGPTL
jgi:hypothetical protein